MAPLHDSAGNLALWLHLRKSLPASDQIRLPDADQLPGPGPLLLVHLEPGQDDPAALGPVLQALRASRTDLRILISGGGTSTDGLPRGTLRIGPLRDVAAVAQMTALLEPAALLILGDDLPAALISGFAGRGAPIIMAEARLVGHSRRGFWASSLTRSLVSRIDHILAPDQPSATLARNLGGRRAAIAVTGPVTDIHAPLRGNEPERLVMAQLLRERHIWLAAAPTVPEADAAIAAHHEVLQYNHRAMLILAGVSGDIIPDLIAKAAEMGMAAVLRSDDEDPCADDQILIAEDDDELGLWYRLAPVCFMGGTLIDGQGIPARHPFEPAALGSAIVHGPLPGPYEAEWAQLDGAGAARAVNDAEGLLQALIDLSSAEQAAILAQNAWGVSTGGAAVVRHISATILGAIGARS